MFEDLFGLDFDDMMIMLSATEEETEEFNAKTQEEWENYYGFNDVEERR